MTVAVSKNLAIQKKNLFPHFLGRESRRKKDEMARERIYGSEALTAKKEKNDVSIRLLYKSQLTIGNTSFKPVFYVQQRAVANLSWQRSFSFFMHAYSLDLTAWAGEWQLKMLVASPRNIAFSSRSKVAMAAHGHQCHLLAPVSLHYSFSLIASRNSMSCFWSWN